MNGTVFSCDILQANRTEIKKIQPTKECSMLQAPERLFFFNDKIMKMYVS